jgi:N6-L-threonylcarbamoyladenine synthase/protein kinase Bud32
MEQVQGHQLTSNLTKGALFKTGVMIGNLHTAGIIHGDLTTSNIIVRDADDECVLIDFGLSQVSSEIEQRGVDVHVLFQTLESTAPDHAHELKAEFIKGYTETLRGGADVITREHEIGLRGRYL